MTDDGMQYDDAADAARFDDQPMPDVTAALADLTFLRPDVEPDSGDQMPEWAWDRLDAALAGEAAARAADAHENVIAFPAVAASAAPNPGEHEPSRALRWAGGLVAASVAVVALGVGVTVMRSGGSDSAVVAGEQAAIISASAQSFAATEVAPDAAAEDGAAAAPAATPAAAVAGPDLRSVEPAPVDPAAKMVMASHTNYTPTALQGQVVSLVNRAGFRNVAEAMKTAAPVETLPPEAGFTSSWDALRACITWLTESPETDALVVDRGTYMGADAGVVVAPADGPALDPSTPAPTATFETGTGMFDVWVVNPECKEVENSLQDFAVYEWAP